MVHRYLPILRWKQGERRGLAQLQVSARADVIPVFQLGPDQFRQPRGKNPHRLSPAQNFANEVQLDWGTAPFYLDASVLPSPAGGPHPLVAIAAAARTAGLHLIPATSLGAPSAYQTAVANVHAIDGRGAALRVDFAEFNSAASWMGGWVLPPNQTDLIGDFKSSVAMVNSMGGTLPGVFAALPGGWRTVTTAGTNMPPDFSGYSAGVHLLPRSEWALWQRLSAAGLPYRLDYGDYATVSLAPPPPGIAWGYPINVKYTLQTEFLICRGVKTTGRGSIDMAPQLSAHARTIQSYPSRAPLAGCWGDDMIDQIAAGASPGALETWVRIGVNRHIERVRTDLP